MFAVAPVWSVSCILLCLAGAAGAQNELPELTTDSVAYCDSLHERLLTLIHDPRYSPPSEVVDLSTKGREMCHDGHVRSGIYRLRRALVIMQQHIAAP